MRILHLLLNITSTPVPPLIIATYSQHLEQLLSASEEQKLSCHLSAGEGLGGPFWLSSRVSFSHLHPTHQNSQPPDPSFIHSY